MNPHFAHLPTAQFLEQLRQHSLSSENRKAQFSQARQLEAASRSQPIVVIDTNVLLDFWIWDDPVVRPLRTLLYDNAFFAVRSDETLDELADVISRSQFSLSFDQQCEILRLWHRLSLTIDTLDRVSSALCRDRDDQKFLNLAASAQADLLVTKDKLLLKTARRAKKDGVRVLTPSQALTVLSAQALATPPR